MFLHQLASTLVIATIMAACASAPTDIRPETTNDPPTLASHAADDAIGDDDYLDGAAPDEIIKCRRVKLTGSRLPKRVCGPMKNDRALFDLVDSGGYEEPH